MLLQPYILQIKHLGFSVAVLNFVTLSLKYLESTESVVTVRLRLFMVTSALRYYCGCQRLEIYTCHWGAQLVNFSQQKSTTHPSHDPQMGQFRVYSASSVDC